MHAFQNDRLSEELKELRIENARLGLYRKKFGEDVTCLSSQILMRWSNLDQGVWLLDVGGDYGVAKGDLVAQDFRLVGRVVSVAERSCLVESIGTEASPISIRMDEGLSHLLMWGKGGYMGEILVREDQAKSFMNKEVVLDAPLSLYGGLLVGHGIGLAEDEGGGMVRLLIRLFRPDVEQTCWVLKDKERRQRGLYWDRDEAAELKNKLRDLEMSKLRSELLKK